MTVKLDVIGDAADGSEQLCRYLRAKMTSAPHGDRRELWAIRTEATTVYWCLLTLRSVGPDDGLAHADRCGAGRECATPDDPALV